MGQGLHLSNGVAGEFDPASEEPLAVVLDSGVASPGVAPRLGFKDEDPVRRYHHMVDIQALAIQVVKDTCPVRP